MTAAIILLAILVLLIAGIMDWRWRKYRIHVHTSPELLYPTSQPREDDR